MIDTSSLLYRSVCPCRSVAKKQVGKTKNPFPCFCSQSYSPLTLMEKPSKRKIYISKAEKIYRQFVLNQKALREQPQARIGGF